MTRIYYPDARATLALVPYDARGPAAARELITLPDIAPISATWTNNTVAEADTFSVEIEERFFPSDPRLFRAAALDLYAGDAGGLDRALASSDENRVMLGHADEVSKDFDAASGSRAVFKGRDYKGLLIDEKWQGRSVQLGVRLDAALRGVLDSVPAASPLTVVTELEDGVPAPTLPTGKGRKGRVWRAPATQNVWKALVDLAIMVGVTVTIRGDQLVIRPARTVDLSSSAVPVLAFGHNISALKISRRFGTRGVPNVRVVALDLDNARTVQGQWPPRSVPTRRVTSSSRGKQKKQQVLIKKFVIQHPAPTVENLTDIARQIHERFAQQQVQIEITLEDMAVPTYDPRRRGGQDENTSFRATQIRNGTPVHLVFDGDVQRVLDASNLSEDGRRRALIEARFRSRVAAVLARGSRVVQTPFFVDRATHKIDRTQGYSLSLSASAYMTVQLDQRFDQ